ncbi:beta-ketoacyl-ACP synthase III [Candidatus Magnetaquicoccus inordinatus]|uniref:beta-ketoacyl-ACP synthase III n=1 Tax=Candidatus Magnetaquicoccus inordinatus TaxID=2496818 RepID=UPI00102BAF82|nr:beta-ketoacyl-ACP synthase III [Candidatus Magnetaquicoccus inordinatus]
MPIRAARIIGTGSYLPEQILSNAELASRLDTTDEWIRSRTGISERRIAAPGEYTSDLACNAAQQALQMAGITADSLDFILVATTTPDLVFPATAVRVQRKLGATKRQMPACDVQAVCAGFIYALSIGDSLIRSGSAQRVLVIGAETMSRAIDWQDRATCILFGDGAGAAILEATTESDHAILSTHLYADGQYEDLLRTPGGISHGLLLDPSSGSGLLHMRGNEVFKQAVKALEEVVDQTLAANGLDKAQIDWLVPHQANIRIIQSTAKRLGMTMDRVVLTVNRHGNTSAASVPLALDEAVRDGRIQPGQLLLLEAFGGGFTWGSALLRW